MTTDPITPVPGAPRAEVPPEATRYTFEAADSRTLVDGAARSQASPGEVGALLREGRRIRETPRVVETVTPPPRAS